MDLVRFCWSDPGTVEGVVVAVVAEIVVLKR